nr:FHA domain-containing protein [Pseudenhygromyxa sp. WMMC2535]
MGFEILNGVETGRELLLQNAEHVLGRGAEADLRIDDTGVSRVHAKVLRTSQGITNLIDLNSKNGIAVNGRRVDVAVLRVGDRVMLGPFVELRFGDLHGEARTVERLHHAEQLRALLTARQLQVAKLVAQGLGNREIAALLGLRVRSIESHLERIYGRLDINTRSALTRMVVEAGFGELS